MQAIQVDLRHVIYALSDALDLVGIDDIGHGKRVGIMAAACGHSEGLSEMECSFLFDLGMLHDIGVSSTRTHNQLVKEFDWQGAQEHCEIGAALLHDFAPLAEMAPVIRYHHTRWDRLQTLALPALTARHANLILLCDRVDALTAPYYASNTVLQHVENIREQIRSRAGSYFAPALVASFLDCSRSEAFWLQLEARALQRYLQDMQQSSPAYQASIAELRQLAVIFARIVDAKSPFTAAHSLGVANVARLIAERMKLSTDICAKIEIAGLLHDLGKLRVPDEILDKPGKLDPGERLVINTHSFETFQILRHIKGFEEIAQWAACHHEEPDGSGNPFRLTAAEMPLEARILRVADILQAMAQNRPYRPGLNATEVTAFLNQLSAQGRVDAEVVKIALGAMPQTMAAALAGDSQPPKTA